jgi:PAS domain S-box-containing protein
MNVVFVSDDTREAELLKNELSKHAQAFNINISPNTQNALSTCSTPGVCDLILLDTSVPRSDAIQLVTAMRGEKKPIAIVAIVEPSDKESLTELFKAGVDSCVLKRAGFSSLLGEALQQAKERRTAKTASPARQARLFFAGDAEKAQQHLARLRHLVVDRIGITPDGLLQLPVNAASPGNIIVVDSTISEIRTEKVVKDAALRAPDVPVILLINPEDEAAAIRAMNAGAADCIAKTDNYFDRLLPAVEREMQRRELVREKTALQSREDRLRQIVESLPVGVTVIAPDGTILAINRAGFKLLGAARLDQMVGKNFLHLLAREDRERTQDFLTTVCGGTNASISVNWKGLDGTVAGIELRAVPMRREGNGSAAALAAIYSSVESPGSREAGAEASGSADLKNILHEWESRLRDLQEKHSLQQSKWEAAIKQAESKRQAAEEQQEKIKNSAKELAVRFDHLREQQSTERATWEQSRKELQEQCAKIEKVVLSLKSAQANLIETHNTEKEQWNLERLQLKQKIQDAAARLSQLPDEHQAERSQWDQVRRELEEKLKASEDQRAAMETALQEAEASLKRQAEEHNDLGFQWDLARQELEQKARQAEEQRAAMESAIHNAEKQLSQRAEAHGAEYSRWDSVRQEQEQKINAAEERFSALQSALHVAEDRLNQLAEERDAERSRLELERQEAEQKFREAEQQRNSLEASLHDANDRLNQLAEERNAERSRLELERQEAEQKFREAEQRQTKLETERLDAEALLNQLTEEHSAERSRWEIERLGLEQKLQQAEQPKNALEASLNDANERLNQLLEERNTERSRWDSERLELEQKAREAEKQRTAIESALHNAEEQLSQKAEAHGAEYSQWDSVRRKQEQKINAAEEQLSAMQSALHAAEARLNQLTEERNTERSRWDSERLELEQKLQQVEQPKNALEASLNDANEHLNQLIEERDAERSQWDLEREEAEQKLQEAEQRQTKLETERLDAEALLNQLTQEHAADRSRWDIERLQSEQKFQQAEEKRNSLEASLHDTNGRLSQLIEERDADRSRWDNERLQSEQKLQQAEEKRNSLEASLHDANERLNQLIEERNADRSRWDNERLQSEQKLQQAEQRQTKLETERLDAEALLNQLTQEHAAERSRWDSERLQSEQKFQQAEEQRNAFEAALRDADARLNQSTEEHAVERSRWDFERQEAEQKFREAEEQFEARLQAAAQEAESRYTQIADENQAKSIQIQEIQNQLGQLKLDIGRLQTELADATLRYQRLSQIISVGVILATKEGRVVECNDSAARMFGYADAVEALGKTNEDGFRIYAFQGILGARLQQEGKLENVEWSSLGRDGRLIRFQENAALVNAPTGESPLVERVLTDITRIHKLGEEIRRIRKMESTGDLTAAAVKSLKNLCESQANCGKLLKKAPDDGKTVRQVADTLLKDANRGIKHASQFLSAALKADRTPSVINLNETLANNDALLHSLVGEDINLQMVLSFGASLVTADRQEIVQLISNLVVSSREALPLGGAMSIETENIEIDASTADYPTEMQSGTYVRMTISADGCAVQPERRTAFNRMIVERMGGWIVTTNEPQSGNIHIVYLPRVEAFAGRAELSSDASEPESPKARS